MFLNYCDTEAGFIAARFLYLNRGHLRLSYKQHGMIDIPVATLVD